MTRNAIDLAASKDKQVVVSAVAHNAKAGAVIMTDNEEVIYLDGIKAWDKSVVGKRVVVEGTLRNQQVYPGVLTPDGHVMQGIQGDQWLIESPKHRLAG